MIDDLLVPITIDQLTVGMFVVKLDIAWLDSPFMSTTRLIKDSDDIRALKEACVRHLVIDTGKGISPKIDVVGAADRLNHQGAASRPSNLANESSLHPQRVVIEPSGSSLFADELPKANALRSKIKKTIEHIQRAFELEAPIDVRAISPLIDSTLDSLTRNDQALMSLAHLSRKDQRLVDHAFGVFCLSLNLALQMKLSASDREQLGIAALLHEAGWAQLPLNLMGKRTPYSANERRLVQQHTVLANRILASSELPPLILRMIDEHHERLDGSGYPVGLNAEQLHPLSRLLSVVDLYEERVHQLTDQPGMIPAKAMRTLYQDASDGLLDQQAVASFISMLGVFPPSSPVLLTSGEKAIVVYAHSETPLLPVVDIHYEKGGAALLKPIRLDLSKDTKARQIEKALDPLVAVYDPANCMFLREEQLG